MNFGQINLGNWLTNLSINLETIDNYAICKKESGVVLGDDKAPDSFIVEEQY